MSRRRQLRTLRGMEQDIADSEPGLYAFFLSFNRRGFGREMPATEKVTGGLRRLMRRRHRPSPSFPGRSVLDWREDSGER